MKQLILVATLVFSSFFSMASEHTSQEVYQKLNIENEISFEVFDKAYTAYQKYSKKDDVLTIIDYTKPSVEERFYLLDMVNFTVIYHSLVTHGKNSGFNKTTKFSNEDGSNATSKGIFRTDDTYYGSNGYSLRLDGLSKGLNDNARSRYIVVHGASYANPEAIIANGGKRLGRSLGCPALPENIARDVIDRIKGGSIIYSHG